MSMRIGPESAIHPGFPGAPRPSCRPGGPAESVCPFPRHTPSRLREGSTRRVSGLSPVLSIAAVLLGLILLPAPGAAQGSPSFWGGIGVGTGSARLSCDICTIRSHRRDDRLGPALGFGVGGAGASGGGGERVAGEGGGIWRPSFWSGSLVGYPLSLRDTGPSGPSWARGVMRYPGRR